VRRRRSRRSCRRSSWPRRWTRGAGCRRPAARVCSWWRRACSEPYGQDREGNNQYHAYYYSTSSRGRYPQSVLVPRWSHASWCNHRQMRALHLTSTTTFSYTTCTTLLYVGDKNHGWFLSPGCDRGTKWPLVKPRVVEYASSGGMPHGTPASTSPHTSSHLVWRCSRRFTAEHLTAEALVVHPIGKVPRAYGSSTPGPHAARVPA
jgi:hypothetical protein